MQEDPRITAAEIARLAGVGRAAVSNWRKRHADFPAPVGGTPASPEFDLMQVEAWLRAQGKLPELSTGDRLWRHLVAAGDDQAATLATVGAFLLAHQRGEAMATTGVEPSLGELLQDVSELADERGAQATFDELWRQFSQTAAGLSRATPDDLADLMVGLAGVAGGSVFDPACGTGSILRSAARAGCTSAYGQELDEQAARLTGLWLALHGVAGAVRVGDSIRADAFAGEAFDAVVCSPPFGVTNWGQEELAYDSRWEYGAPPRTEPELAWVQHALAHLRPGGSAVLLMPPAAASRRAGRRIRAELLRRGVLRAVVALPARAAAPHGVSLHLWVLRRPVADAPLPSHVLLVDAAPLGEPGLAAYAQVLKTFRAFAADPEAPVEEPGFARAVPVIELLDEEVDLTPARRHVVSGVADTGEHLRRTRERLNALVEELPALMPDVVAGPEAAPAPLTVSIAELSRTGALQIIGPVRPAAAASDAGAIDERPVLTVQDVVHGQDASGRAEKPLSPEIIVLPGDVVVPMVARQLTARVVTREGALLGRNLYLLRPNPAALDPWFLAGQLRTSANERQTSSLSGTLRFDIKRAQLPRVPLDEQRRHGEAFRQLDAFDGALRKAAALGADLVRMTADGLAAGALRPGDDPDRTSR